MSGSPLNSPTLIPPREMAVVLSFERTTVQLGVTPIHSVSHCPLEVFRYTHHNGLHS
jgi:hypothetical protein